MLKKGSRTRVGADLAACLSFDRIAASGRDLDLEILEIGKCAPETYSFQSGGKALRRPGTKTLLLLALTAAFLYLSLFILPATPRLLDGDQFINFDNARRMVQGQTLYRDIFQYTLPGTELLEAPLIRIFGAKLALIHALLIVTYVAYIWLALRIGLKLLNGKDAALASLLFLCFGLHCGLDATHHIFSVLFVYLAAAVVIERRSLPRLIAAGFLLGIATCFTQTRALLVPAVGGFLVWENGLKPPNERRLLREEMSLLAPFAALVILASAYVIWNVGLANFYRYIIRFPFVHYRDGQGNNWSTAFEDWVPTARGIATWSFMKLLVPGSYLALFAYGWMRSRRGGSRLPLEAVLLAVVGLALFCTVAYAPLHVRLAGMSLPAFILVIWMLNQGGNGLWKAPAWGVTAAFLVLAPLKTQLQHYWFYNTPAGRVAIEDEGLFSDLAWLDQHTEPGDKFFAASTPMFYVLLDLQNPARVPFVEPDGYTRPRQVARTAKRLHREAPKFVLWPFSQEDSDDPDDPLYLLGRELRKDYRPVESLPDGTVWESTRGASEVSVKSQGQSPYQLEMLPPE